jgi:hypothetical protein
MAEADCLAAAHRPCRGADVSRSAAAVRRRAEAVDPARAEDALTVLQPTEERTMNPLKLVTRPVTDLAGAFLMPLKALFVVGLTGFINAATYNGQWWFKWVAFGMGIAVLVAWARAARTLLLLALVGFVGWKIYQRYGEGARRQFDDWVARTQPQAAQVLQAWRSGASTTTGPGAA